MTKFVLVYSGGDMPASEAEGQAIMNAWTDWYSTLASAVVDPGYPFTQMAKTIKSDGSIMNGAQGGLASGYTILEAESYDEAVRMAKGCPVLKANGSVTVYETFPVMQMA